MKKIGLFLLLLIFLCSCSKKDKIELLSFERKEDKYCLSVNNKQDTFDFKNYFDSSYEWTVSSDSFGQQTFLTKTVPLVIGDNEYFIIVSDENYTTFDCVIKRLDVYYISFDSKGGSYIEPMNIQEGSVLDQVPEPIREGYRFKGWDYDFTKPILSNLYLEAEWEASDFYTINYDSNGGTGIETSQSFELGESGWYSVGLNIGKEGCYLDSWNTKQDGTGTSYQLGSGIVKPKAETITLYAIWKPIELWDGVTRNDPIRVGEYYYVRRASELIFYGKTILLNDIDLNNQEWTPVSSFNGEFDGNNHKIMNMKITKVSANDTVGLVGLNKGLIKNLILDNYTINLSNVNMSNTLYVGGLVGYNRGIMYDGDGKIVNCKASGSIVISGSTSPLYVGGLVGRTDSYFDVTRTYIQNSSTSGTIDINSSNNVYCGGIVGSDSSNPIRACYSSTSINVNTSKYAYVGSIIGSGDSGTNDALEISDCVALGNINVNSPSGAVAALLGYYGMSTVLKFNNNYSLETQKVVYNSNNVTANYRNSGTRATLKEINAKISYDIEFGD